MTRARCRTERGSMKERSQTVIASGLDGVAAAETRLSAVNGEAGELIIAGFPVEELAGRATFEEVVYLLWHDTLPDAAQLAAFRDELGAQRPLPRSALELVRAAVAERVPAMDALRMAAGTVSLGTAAKDGTEALALVARLPTIVAAYWRLLGGDEPVAPDPGLGHTANYLYMLTGEEPVAEAVRALETYLNTVADHGMNASTFAARVIVSTRSDVVSAVVGAIGALKGPLHGGAPGPALDVVFEVENTALRVLAEHRPGRNLQTNVEFYTALLLHGLGMLPELFSPTFAVSRVAGWTANCFEQRALDRIIRPQSAYVGEKVRRWGPLEGR